MISRWADPADTNDLISLWVQCFHDEPEAAASFFSHFPPQIHTRIIQTGCLAAMASWMSVTIADKDSVIPGAYLYAVATHEDCRRKGLCRTLLSELEAELRKQNCQFTALYPAEESLYAYYGSMGYVRAMTLTACPSMQKPGDWEIAPDAYRQEREAWLKPPYCRWEGNAYAYLADTGVHFFNGSHGCYALASSPKGPRILEAPGQTQASKGMIKWLDTALPIENIALGFAFD